MENIENKMQYVFILILIFNIFLTGCSKNNTNARIPFSSMTKLEKRNVLLKMIDNKKTNKLVSNFDIEIEEIVNQVETIKKTKNKLDKDIYEYNNIYYQYYGDTLK